MTQINITGEQNAALREQVAVFVTENPSRMVRDMAMELGVTEGRVVAALPDDMRLHIPGSEFIPVWEAMTKWEKVTFLAETPGAILEVCGALPQGKLMHGMYNLLDKSFALGGHLLIGKIASIWLVSKPAFGMESHSVQFFTQEGFACFSIYLGRQQDKTIIPSVKKGYQALWASYAEKGAVQ